MIYWQPAVSDDLDKSRSGRGKGEEIRVRLERKRMRREAVEITRLGTFYLLYFFILIFFYSSIINIQYFVSFRCTI